MKRVGYVIIIESFFFFFAESLVCLVSDAMSPSAVMIGSEKHVTIVTT